MTAHVATMPDLAAQVARCAMRPATVSVGRRGLVVGGRVAILLPADEGRIVADVAGFAPGWDAGAVIDVEWWRDGGPLVERWVVVATGTARVTQWSRAASQVQWLVGGPL